MVQTSLKKAGLQVGGYVTEVAPLMVYLGINWQKYAPTTTETVKLSFGCVLICFFALLMALDKVKAPKMVVVFGVIFGLSFLINSIMQDIMWVSGMAFAGALGQETIFNPLVEKYTAMLSVENTIKAEENYKAVAEKKARKKEATRSNV